MPYLSQRQREELEAEGWMPETPGELNYVITRFVLDYWHRKHDKNYQLLNDIIGAMESAKLEFYARIVRPYEDLKRSQNGDVYA